MERLREAIKSVLIKRGFEFTLKEKQLECISSIVCDRRDVLAVLPTGYGESVMYQILPDVFDIMLGTEKSMVLVISPLNALMQDQITKLRDRGISACMIHGHGIVVEGDASIDFGTKLPLDKLANPVSQLLYMYAEVCVNDKKIVHFFNSPIYQERAQCVVADEAPLVLNCSRR